MKLIKAILLTVPVLLCFHAGAESPSANLVNSTVQNRLHQIVSQIQAKTEAGKHEEADFANEFRSFDVLLAEQNGARTEDAAVILTLKAQVYIQVFKDYVKTAEILGQVATNYPNTENGKHALLELPDVKKLAAAQRIQDSLAVGSNFPDFAGTDLRGNPLSARAFKGKLVLIDFWATWCPECVKEMPNVISTYQKHHRDGFEVIGINLDHDRPTLDNFLTKQPAISWPQYFDGKGWTNTIAVQYGVMELPFSILVGPNGKIIARNLRGPEFEMAVAEALALQPK